MPLRVSVIIPIYKVEPYLRRCVDTVLGQTLAEQEVILVDDGSPDGCGAICDEYAAKDERVRIIHKENGGVMSAFLAGLRAARADYVGFVDGDDWVDPGYFEALYAAAVETGADAVMAGYIEHGPDGERCFDRDRPEVFPAPDGGRRFLARYYGAAPDPRFSLGGVNARWTKLYRRQLLLDDLPYFSPDVWHGEDLVTNAAVLADCRCVVHLAGGPKYHYILREGSLSSDKVAEPFTDRWAENERAFLAAMGKIVRDKGLLPDCFCGLLGRSAYAAALNCLARRDVPYAARRRYVRDILALAPAGSLAAYARERKNFFVRLYCLFLRARLILPCAVISALFIHPPER